MESNRITIEEVLATFSNHVSKHYPNVKNFRRNFNMLLKGKRDRLDQGQYELSLEKNIVFLNDLVAGGERFLERLLAGEKSVSSGEDVASALAALEAKAHEGTTDRHREAFIDGKDPEFEELVEARAKGGSAYMEKLEFHYRYLMMLRIFLFEFISVLAAVLAQYMLAKGGRGAVQKARSHLELTAHYYLGNVEVGERAEGNDEGRPLNER
jgi:hypothetical protein